MMGLRVAFIMMGVAAVLGVFYWFYSEGREAERAANDARNIESTRRANRGDDAVSNCDGMFDFWTQKCDGSP